MFEPKYPKPEDGPVMSLAEAQRIIAKQRQELADLFKAKETFSQSEIWRHVKSGGLYTIKDNNALIEATLVRAVCYASLFDGQVWVRPAEEFYDGRFVNIAIDELTGETK